MRQFIALVITFATVAGGGIALAGQAATDSKGRFVDLSVGVTPPVSGTANKPHGVGINFDSFTGNRINGNIPSNSNSIVVRFNKGFKSNGPLFPACQINLKGYTVCPKSTQIGTGSGEVAIFGQSKPTFVSAELVVYNGKPYKGTPTLIFIGLLNGKPAAELDFTYKQQPTGPYGLAFTEIVFPSSGPPTMELTKFSVTIPDRTTTAKVHGKRVTVHMIVAPTTCNGSWQFSQTNGFSDGSPPLTATDSVPCARG